MLEELFNKAEKNGIKKGAIGVKVFGRVCYTRIYRLDNPTQNTLNRIKKAINELIKEKNNKQNHILIK